MKRFVLLPVLLVAMLVFAACAPVPSTQTAPAEAATEAPAEATTAAPTEAPAEEPAEAELMDIVDTAVAAGSFNTLVTAVQAAELVDALKGEGPFTVFAPTDEAFAAIPAETLNALLADPKGDLTQILLYHVLSGAVMAESVTDGLEAETLQGSPVKFSIVDGQPMINDAKIVTTDIAATNGVIHVIDAVIMPTAEEAAAEGDMAAEAELKDIVDTAVAAGSFNTLVTAVQAAELVDALKGEGPFTVFAPTDEAFAAIPAETLNALLADPKGDLSQILLYHVLSGAVMAESVTDGLEAETLQGGMVKFSIVDGQPMINNAKIVTTDIAASNGVIHVIDAVILPE